MNWYQMNIHSQTHSLSLWYYTLSLINFLDSFSTLHGILVSLSDMTVFFHNLSSHSFWSTPRSYTLHLIISAFLGRLL